MHSHWLRQSTQKLLYAIEGLTQKRRIVTIGRCAHRSEWYALGIDYHRAFDASLPPIYRTSARPFSSARRLGDAAIHGYVRKLEADGSIVCFLDDLFECVHRPSFYPLIASAS